MTFLNREKTSEELVGNVREICSLTESVPIEWPGDMISGPERRVVMLMRPGSRDSKSENAMTGADL